MGHIDVVSEREFDEPVLVEGLPGAGLVGKIVADHLVEAFDMDHYANVHCDALPPTASYSGEDRTVRTPVRLHATDDSDMLVLQSDVPVSPDAAEEFGGCIAEWFDEASVTPLYVAGLRRDGSAEGPPALHGIAVGDGGTMLDRAGLTGPGSPGLVSGPTGALLAHALETGLDAVGIVVDVDSQFPDPMAARVVLEGAVEPITGLDVGVDELEEQAERIQRAKERLATRMQQGDRTVSQAQTLRMYQ
ncbi:3-isopropylmalate dehydratase [Halobacteriales archaeon QS_6_71_20]|nr:MAG: 3-isopropylmalate dehydratase [Halobacteriales archaeon QS_6_71_20]